MKYEIKGGSFPVVICNLENGEKMITEKGSMAWMSPNMQMETHGVLRFMGSQRDRHD